MAASVSRNRSADETIEMFTRPCTEPAA
jgi:hypothetical protein